MANRSKSRGKEDTATNEEQQSASEMVQLVKYQEQIRREEAEERERVRREEAEERERVRQEEAAERERIRKEELEERDQRWQAEKEIMYNNFSKLFQRLEDRSKEEKEERKAQETRLKNEIVRQNLE